MYPVLFKIGPLTFHSYGAMIALGFFLILHLIRRDAQRVGIDPEQISHMAFVVLLVGVLGTRIAHILMFPEEYSWSDPIGWIAVWRGGLVFQGAIPPVLIYIVYAFKRRGLPFWPMQDLFIPYVPLAQAFGRLGCFMYGCCFGKRADSLLWAVQFPPGSPAAIWHAQQYPTLAADTGGWSYPVHPTQLYGVLGLSFTAAVLWLMRRYWCPFPGFTSPLYLMLYGIGRVFVEFFRGDGNPSHWGGGILTDQQIFAILMFIAGLVLFVYLYKNPPRDFVASVSSPRHITGVSEKRSQ
jgi:phosphatidylglycerol:prolipoprotein diacylglycerol transferase